MKKSEAIATADRWLYKTLPYMTTTYKYIVAKENTHVFMGLLGRLGIYHGLLYNLYSGVWLHNRRAIIFMGL